MLMALASYKCKTAIGRFFILHGKRRYNTIEKLNNLNRDFCTFIDKISKVLNAPEKYIKEAKDSFESTCDKIFESDEEQERYCKEHNIPY